MKDECEICGKVLRATYLLKCERCKKLFRRDSTVPDIAHWDYAAIPCLNCTQWVVSPLTFSKYAMPEGPKPKCQSFI